ncbi:MAG: NAD-dependent epimerase/dehydratase family protein [Halioglobus sp.]
MSNVLVIGGQGFVGSHVCDSLATSGHRVRVISRSSNATVYQNSTAEYLHFDYKDTDKLEDALKGIDCVIHLASSMVPSSSNLDPVADIESNLVPTVALLELMRKVGPKRIIYLSSGGTVYGNPLHVPITESHPLNPICSYGITKVAVENYLLMYQTLYGFRPLILRPSNPYGPRQGHFGTQGLINTFLNLALRSEPLTVWGDGTVVRDFFYVKDLAKLCEQGVEYSKSGVFNIGSGEGTSINDVIHIVREVTGRDLMITYKGRRSYDVSENYLDVTKAKSILGWNPEVSIRQGIAEHWDWLESQYAT